MKFYTENEKVKLTLKLTDGNVSKFVKAKVYDYGMNYIQSVNLDHKENGLYEKSLTLIGEYFYIIYEIYTNSSYSIKDESYQELSEFIAVVKSIGQDGTSTAPMESIVGIVLSSTIKAVIQSKKSINYIMNGRVLNKIIKPTSSLMGNVSYCHLVANVQNEKIIGRLICS